MVEYGQGVSQATGAGGGGQAGAGSGDVGAAAVNTLGDLADRVLALPPEYLVVGAIVLLAGLIILRRAF